MVVLGRMVVLELDGDVTIDSDVVLRELGIEVETTLDESVVAEINDVVDGSETLVYVTVDGIEDNDVTELRDGEDSDWDNDNVIVGMVRGKVLEEADDNDLDAPEESGKVVAVGLVEALGVGIGGIDIEVGDDDPPALDVNGIDCTDVLLGTLGFGAGVDPADVPLAEGGPLGVMPGVDTRVPEGAGGCEFGTLGLDLGDSEATTEGFEGGELVTGRSDEIIDCAFEGPAGVVEADGEPGKGRIVIWPLDRAEIETVTPAEGTFGEEAGVLNGGEFEGPGLFVDTAEIRGEFDGPGLFVGTPETEGELDGLGLFVGAPETGGEFEGGTIF